MQKDNQKGIFYLLAAALLGLLILTYSNHFSNPFHFDDDHTIVTNQYIRSVKNIPLFFKDASTFSSLPANQAYRPGVTTLNAIDFWLGGKNEPIPFYFHLSIFISFLFLGILLFFFFLKIFNNAGEHARNKWFALFAAGFFCLHTANAETINYIIARSDSFSTLMIVLAFVLFMYKPTWRNKLIYLLPVMIGFFAKEPTVMILPLLIIYVYLFEQDGGISELFSTTGLKKLGRSVWPFLALGAVLVLLLLLSSHFASKNFTPGGSSRWLYILTQPFVFVHYFNNFLIPMNLSADTDWTLVGSAFDDRVLAGTGFILILLVIAWAASGKKEWRPVTFGILWFFLALLPTSVVPLSEVLNDHRTFFPYVGLVIAAVWPLALLARKYETNLNSAARIGMMGVGAAVLLAHAYGTHNRNKVWSSGESLWHDVTIKSPNNPRGLMNYGNALMAKGELKEALGYYERAKNIWPAYSYVYINIGIVKSSMGKPEEAEANFKEALQLNIQNPECYYYYARFLMTSGRIDEALKVVDAGLKISPGHLSMTNLKAQLQQLPSSNTSKLDQAIINASTHPTSDNYIELSLQYYLAGQYEMCVKAAEEAIKIKPDNAIAYNNICSAYNVLKQWDKAIDAGKKGLAIDPSNERLKNNLAASYAGKNGK